MGGIGEYFSKKEIIRMINLKVVMKEKKVKERSSVSSIDDTDVFDERMESAAHKAILFNCLKDLVVKVKEILI